MSGPISMGLATTGTVPQIWDMILASQVERLYHRIHTKRVTVGDKPESEPEAEATLVGVGVTWDARTMRRIPPSTS